MGGAGGAVGRGSPRREDASALKAPMERGQRGQEWGRAREHPPGGVGKTGNLQTAGARGGDRRRRQEVGEREERMRQVPPSPVKVESENASPELGVAPEVVVLCER